MLLKQIQYFMAVAEYRHFTRAAERLFVSQSALSQQMTKLENDLGVKLINRDQHPVALTPAGQDFWEAARKILDDVQALEHRMQKHLPPERRTLRIGMITGLGNIKIADILTSFCDRYPEINFTITNKLSKELCQMLLTGDLDLALFAAPYGIETYDLEFFPLEDEEFVLIVPANHPLAARPRIDLADARDEKFIFPTSDNVSHDIFLSECEKAGFAPKIISECNGPGRRLDLVKSGLGIALISLSGLDYYNSQSIAAIRLRAPFYKRIVLARARKKRPLAAPQTLWTHILESKM